MHGQRTCKVNSEGFLAEVFHPWVRWEGPGSGFENSSGAGAVPAAPAASGNPSGWAQAGPKWVGPRRAQVGGLKLGPRGWAQAGPTWVGPSRAEVGGPRIHRFGPLGIEVEKQGFANGPADNRSKVSVKKSQIGFVVINFSRRIFLYV